MVGDEGVGRGRSSEGACERGAADGRGGLGAGARGDRQQRRGSALLGGELGMGRGAGANYTAGVVREERGLRDGGHHGMIVLVVAVVSPGGHVGLERFLQL